MATTTASAAAAATAAAGKAPGGARTPAAGRAGRAWRIVAEGDAFAVYHGTRRMAWGLRTREAAGRWVVRLGGTPPLDLAAAPRAVPRAWWGEDDR